MLDMSTRKLNQLHNLFRQLNLSAARLLVTDIDTGAGYIEHKHTLKVLVRWSKYSDGITLLKTFNERDKSMSGEASTPFFLQIADLSNVSEAIAAMQQYGELTTEKRQSLLEQLDDRRIDELYAFIARAIAYIAMLEVRNRPTDFDKEDIKDLGRRVSHLIEARDDEE